MQKMRCEVSVNCRTETPGARGNGTKTYMRDTPGQEFKDLTLSHLASTPRVKNGSTTGKVAAGELCPHVCCLWEAAAKVSVDLKRNGT